MVDLSPVIYTISAGIIGAAVGAYLTIYLSVLYDKQKMKRELLCQFVGNCWMFADPSLRSEVKKDVFVPLNHIFVIFHDSPKVISALEKMHRQMHQKDCLVENIRTLVVEMCKSSGIKIEDLDSELIVRPFAPSN